MSVKNKVLEKFSVGYFLFLELHLVDLGHCAVTWSTRFSVLLFIKGYEVIQIVRNLPAVRIIKTIKDI